MSFKVTGNSAIVIDQTISTSIQSAKIQKESYVSPSHDTKQVHSTPDSPLKNKRSIGGMVSSEAPVSSYHSIPSRLIVVDFQLEFVSHEPIKEYQEIANKKDFRFLL